MRISQADLNFMAVKLQGTQPKGDDVKPAYVPESQLGLEFNPEFAGAPPCLKVLVDVGFPKGTMHDGLFNLGVFAKMKFPSNWEAKVWEYNERFMSPGAPAEVKGIIKSLNKKGYNYKCSQPPIKEHCKPHQCKFCEFGAFPKDWIFEINETHPCVIVGGKFRTLITNPNGTIDFMDHANICNLYKNRPRIQISDDSTWNRYEAYLHHGARKDYEGVVFDPSCKRYPKALNLFTGVMPCPSERPVGDWQHMRRHIKEVLANGKPRDTKYIEMWLAKTRQRITVRTGQETCLVFKGPQGSGKGILGRSWGEVFCAHFLHTASSETLSGQFNYDTIDKIFIFADEVVWGGNKQAAGVLKALITEPHRRLRKMRVDPVNIDNYVNLMLSSNNQWVFPAEAGERRAAIFEVPDTHMQDRAWFGPIYEEMAGVGLQCMLYDLMHMEIDDNFLAEIPRDAALFEQVYQGLDQVDRFVFERLACGALTPKDDLWGFRVRDQEYTVIAEYKNQVLTSDFQHFLIGYTKQSGEQTRRGDQTSIGMRLNKLLGNMVSRRRVTLQDGYRQKQQALVYEFAPLAECRKAFSKSMKLDIDWVACGEEAAATGLYRSVETDEDYVPGLDAEYDPGY